MPRPGGESDKLGNHFEAVWSVETAIDVLQGLFDSITVEPVGEDAQGVEFYVKTPNGKLQFHSVKRQKSGGDWSIADVCYADKVTGRSILGDLFNKLQNHPDAELRFVSSTGANELRDLSEKSKTQTKSAEFKNTLSATLRNKFDQKIVPLCNGDAESALAALKSLEVILRSHNDLIRTVERRIDELFCRVDRSAINSADLRRLLADFILDNLGKTIDASDIQELFRANEIVARNNWTNERTTVAAANKRYLSVAEVELINSAQIDREVVPNIIDALTRPHHRGALLVAPGGFGKSCVLAQCLKRLEANGTPYLCLRMDAVEPCHTSRQLGAQLDLPASPAVVLDGIANNRPSILVVDQLDAMSLVSGRNPHLWEVFSELREEVQAYPQMKMLVACRDFDLNHDSRLRTLEDEQAGFSTFRLEKLTKAEIESALDEKHLFHPNDRQVEILGVPFHLLLFLQGDPSRGFTGTGELYDRYWNRKRRNVRDRLGRDSRWDDVIDAMTKRMSEQQVLFAPEFLVDAWPDDVKAMTSEHVLVEVQNKSQYRFFHESFFDYAYARRFCATGRSVVEFLRSSEQHLFRRAQVRQILAYRREHDFKQYLVDIREIFESPKIRFHIKRMVASGLKQIDQPTAEEWKLVEPYLLEGELSRYVSLALRNHFGWFDLLNSQQVFQDWLASSDSRLNNAAIWYLEAHELHQTRSAAIAELISPYTQRDDQEWTQRIQRVMSWGIAHNSEEMSAIYIALIKRGAYDDYKSNAGSDFWSQHHNAEKENPKFIIDVLATWFDRAVNTFDDGETWNFLDKCPQNHSHVGSMLIGKAAADEPDYFLEHMLPRVVETILRSKLNRGGSELNRAWPWLSNHGDPFDINDAILFHIRRSLQHLAIHNVELFRKYAATFVSYPQETFAYLLLRSWADNPQEFADECARYITADQRRLNIGYGSWSGGGEALGESAISRMALKAISPHCSPELFGELESKIIGYSDEYEKKDPSRRGFAELLVLRSLNNSRISTKAALRIEELERKFPKLPDAIPEEDETNLVKCVGSPIEENIAAIMTDEQWISAMQKYDGSTDRFEGGPIELSRSLAEFARKDRARFASLVEKMPSDINAMYFSAVLEGICSRHTNLNKEEKETDQREIEATPTETFINVIERLHRLPNRPCGSAIVGCIRTLSERQLSPRVLDIVSFYATSDPDPREEIWQQDAGGNKYYGGDPHFHGINSVRGQAAEAIHSLLFDDQTRIDQLRAALVALSEDSIISVRTCAIEAFLPLLNFERDLAVELFLKASGLQHEICATAPFEQFVHYAVHTHYAQLRQLIQFALGSSNAKAIEHASRQVTLAELQDVDVGGDAASIRSGNDVMRKAAADVYARNLSHKVVGDRCAQRLEEFFTDSSKSVREEISSAFFHTSGERLLQLKDFIARFIESPCFEHETEGLLRALEESKVELPKIVCRAAERILGFLGEEGTHIAYHGSVSAHGIATLVVRQYEQATDDALKTRCLDLIDQMERVGYLGVGEELNKIDR
jgi:hypothetical protein